MNAVAQFDAGAYKKASSILKIMANPCMAHIITTLRGNYHVEASQMVTSKYSHDTIYKCLRKLREIRLIRREQVGREVTYRLNYERLKQFNEAIAIFN